MGVKRCFVFPVVFACAAFAGGPTFREIASIIETHCAGCHQAGEIGPMPLTTYAEARPWAKAIKQAVVQGTMPPWQGAGATSEQFATSRLVKDSEIRKLAEWADGGAPEGEPRETLHP